MLKLLLEEKGENQGKTPSSHKKGIERGTTSIRKISRVSSLNGENWRLSTTRSKNNEK
jgi:hypothetical protein